MGKEEAIETYGNMFRYQVGGDFRPRIQELDDGEFALYELENGNAYIHKNDIDDLIGLLKAVKLNGYKIEE